MCFSFAGVFFINAKVEVLSFTLGQIRSFKE